uniref:Cubilin n=1 Tax=Timema tahoe TaxID=61484 RepID=A0A7R9FM80_9NEOP|nr:unnamed protein product [Timema tahoe]
MEAKGVDWRREAEREARRDDRNGRGCKERLRDGGKNTEERVGIARRVAVIEASINNGSIGAAGGSPAGGTGGIGLNTLERQVRQIVTLLNRNECGSSPCLNGGTCEDKYSGFICRCPPNWEVSSSSIVNYSGPRCDMDVNECARFAGTDLGCQNGATCVNKPGTYECVCRQGFYGTHCTLKTNDCSASSSSDLCGHGVCVNQISATRGFTCICKQGWTADAVTGACTQDIDECASNHPACSHDPPVDCINVPGSFYCRECPRGYTGNGYYCRDIDECSVNNGGCSINPNVQCINTQGSRRCGDCPPGFQGDGVNCVYLGTCQVNNGGCHYLATCTNAGATIMCICPNGYNGPGVGPNGCVPSSGGGALSPSNPCSSNPCLHGFCHISEDRPSSYYCTCIPGYTGCGGILSTEQGTLKFPNSGSSFYSTQMNCAWIIVVNTTKVINITFSSFNLEKSTTCSFDWLQIHDGSGAGDHMIGRYCGDKLPKNGTIISTHNYLYLWFRSDYSRVGEGFELTWNSTEPLCGGELSLDEASHGTLQSPGSPGKYPNNRDCYWKLINANYNKRIQFHFFTLLIESHPNCSFDYLEILDGWTTDSPLLNKYCNSSHPAPLTTPGPFAMVHFHSDNWGNDAGFQISYTLIEGIPGCGGVLTGPSGSFSSPNHPDTYRENMECEWKIQLPVGERIELTFTAFSLEDSHSCKFDYVEVRDGDNINSPLIGRYCGSQLPPIAMSTSNNMVVKFRSDWSYSAEGFRISFQSICGGIFSDLTGTIHSPYYPRSYPSNRICIYHIALPPGKAIQLTFQDFDVEDTLYPTCPYDHVQIRDGDTENSTLIGTYCGEDNDMVPPPVLSTHNYLWIKFKTDSSLVNKGFLANYSSVDVLCGGIYKLSSGTIQTPAHPDTYPPGTECRWVISTSPGKVIQLTFTTFNLEDGSYSIDCPFDSVTIYDNSSIPNTGGIMGKFCGNTIPPVLTSVGNMITINFKSDFSRQMEGFSANYIIIDTSTMCGGSYFSATGMIRSPNYPNSYPRNKNCVWKITAPSGQQIMLNVTDFKLEHHHFCRFDYLEIKNGGYETSPLLGKFCGTTITKIMRSFSNQIYIHFVSDYSGSHKGFSIHWDATSTGCGGTLASSSGSIISPNYPQPYNHKAECLWKVIVSRGSAIQMVFVDLDLESQTGCLYDYVEVRDGIDSSAKRIGRYCTAGSHPLIIHSTGNHLFVKFRSDISRSGRGFHIKFDTGYRGVIESPNFPLSYPGNMDCTWNITATQGNKLNLTFSHFELESVNYYMPDSNNHCIYDYVEVKAGSGSDSPTQVLGKFCGQDIPAPISSTTDHIYIHFVTDSFTAYSCGDHFEHPRGVFTSPNYPNSYPYSTTCEWLITVDWGKSVEVTIEDFDLEGSVANCQYDALRWKPSQVQTRDRRLVNKLGTESGQLSGSGRVERLANKLETGSGQLSGSGRVDRLASKLGTGSGQLSGSVRVERLASKLGTGSGQLSGSRRVERLASKLGTGSGQLSGSVRVERLASKLGTGSGQLSGSGRVERLANKLGTGSGQLSGSGRVERLANKLGTESGQLSGSERFERLTSKLGTGSGQLAGSERVERLANKLGTGSGQLSGSGRVDRLASKLGTGSGQLSGSGRVYGGPDDTAPLLGEICTNQKSIVKYTSSGENMYLRFVSDSSFVGKGFRASYKTVDSHCGGKMMAPFGQIHSSNYPDNYGHNDDCMWYIEVDQNHVVKLSFIDFDIEAGYNCSYDYLRIFDGNTTDSPILLTHCGNQLPNQTAIKSTGNKMTIRMKSDGTRSAKGFLANYTMSCGARIVTEESGMIRTQESLNVDRSNKNCSWIIMGSQPDDHVTLTFTHLSVPDTDFGSECSYYYIEVRDGEDKDSPQIGKYCSTRIPAHITSQGSALFVQAVAVYGYHFGNFEATYSVLSSACGGNLTSEHGSFTSPGYPNSYPVNAECVWVINTSPGNRAQLSFQMFDLENNCAEDYVEVRRDNATGPLMGEYCGNTIPSNLTAGHVLWVKFRSSDAGTAGGFVADYSLLHGNELFGASGQVASPLYPHPFFHDGTYNWRITVQFGKAIAISFKDFYIPTYDTDTCYFSLKIYDGYDNTAPTLLERCGLQLPDPVTSSANIVYISLDFNLVRTGIWFLLEWQEVDKQGTSTGMMNPSQSSVPGCGGSFSFTEDFNVTSYNLTSPGYPLGYEHNLNCEWLIQTPPGFHLQLVFNDVNLEAFDQCYSCDYVQVFSGDNGKPDFKSVGTFCMRNATQEPPVTTTNMMKVVFHSDIFMNKTGFSATVVPVCGGLLFGPSGYIDVMNKTALRPNSWSFYFQCQWNITVRTGRTIAITFEEFKVFSTDTTLCQQSNVVLRNGGSSDSPPLGNGKYCGTTIPVVNQTTGNKLFVKYTGNRNSLVSCFAMCKLCAKEYVELFDGGSQSAKLLGHYCTRKPSSILTTGNMLSVHYFTETTDPHNGFLANIAIATCGGTLRGWIGTLTSPSYPGSYPTNQNCTWLIEGVLGHYFIITFQEIKTLSMSDCSGDYIEILESFDYNNTVATWFYTLLSQ